MYSNFYHFIVFDYFHIHRFCNRVRIYGMWINDDDDDDDDDNTRKFLVYFWSSIFCDWHCSSFITYIIANF
jgi:hypothetical protein